MINTNEAHEIVMCNQIDWGTELVPIDHCNGRVLREDVLADRDFPPYDRVTMDGIAVKYDDFQKGVREFEINGLQTAGEPQKILKRDETAHEIMTGAIMSAQADLVIKYEDIEIVAKQKRKYAVVKLESSERWKNVHKRGLDGKMGDSLLKKGRVLSSSDAAILATVGKSEVLVSRHPIVAIISTGDELVEVNQMPQAHQIRMSNSIMLQTKLNELNVRSDRFHFEDDYESLLQKVGDVLKSYDVILLSGGVSKGKAENTTEVLEKLGVNKQFHRVAQRPGKPFWFGDRGRKKFVFALPGNPVSTFMCFIVYFLPWLKSNLKVEEEPAKYAQLMTDYTFKPELTYFLQVNCFVSKEGLLLANPEEGGGSGDLANLVKSNAFLELPPERQFFKKGESLKVHVFRNF